MMNYIFSTIVTIISFTLYEYVSDPLLKYMSAYTLGGLSLALWNYKGE